jgi:hypothetical protein
MKPTTLLTLLAAFFVLQNKGYAQSKIDTSKKELTEKEGVNYNKSSSSSSSSSFSDSDDDNILKDIIVGAFMYTVGGVGYYGLIGDYKNEDHLYNDLTRYPFQQEGAGNFYNPKFGENKVYVFRVDAKDKLMYSNADLYGNHLEAKIRPLNAFYLKTDYYQLFEHNNFNGNTDKLSLFYVNFAYDRIRFQRFNLGWMAGASYVGGDVNKAGFSFGANTEFFLKKDFSFLASAKWSFINGKPVHAYEAEVRYHKKNFFATAGFEQLIIASPHYNFATLGGGLYF